MIMKSSKFDYAKYITILVATMASTALIIFIMFMFNVSFNFKQEECSIIPNNKEKPDILTTATRLGNHLFLDRSAWGGRDLPIKSKRLEHPVDLVIIGHTVTPFCSTFTECSRNVRSIQDYHVNSGYPDISYNFLIGGDGNIYVGRGWDVINSSASRQSIFISFIGNFVYDFLNDDMIDAAGNLLNEGVKLGKLDTEYKIICHNQTRNTISPGVNVYKVVKTWPHYSPIKTR